MKPSDVVNQLRAYLPRSTGLFTDNLSATISITAGTGTVTTTQPHGASVDDAFGLYNAITQKEITAIELDTGTALITLNQDHDFTLDDNLDQTITLGGFAEPEWNGDFVLEDVPNRQQLIIDTTNESLPVIDGNQYVNEVLFKGAAFFKVTSVTDSNNFEFETTEDDTEASGTVALSPRVIAVPNLETIARQYTEQDAADDLWAFVIMGTSSASKDRNIENDSVAAKTAADDRQIKYMRNFQVVVLFPTQKQYSALGAMDLAHGEVLQAMSSTLTGWNAPNQLSGGDRYNCNMIGDDVQDYNGAFYAHSYQFEFVYESQLEDQFTLGDDRAYRDFSTDIFVGDEELIANGNLDQEPIP